MGKTETRTDQPSVERLADEIERFLAGSPRYFAEVVTLAPEGRYRDLLRAWGVVRGRARLERDEEGRYAIPAGAPRAGGQS